jgi:amino acid transporter
MLTSLPAILFAFDSFLIVGNIASHVKNPKRNVPLSIVLSMVTSGFIYLMVTISQIISGCGSPYLLFSFIFGDGNLGNTIGSIIISVFIMIAIFGVINSMSMAIVNSSQSLIEDNIIMGQKLFNKINNRRYLMGGYVLGLMTIGL